MHEAVPESNEDCYTEVESCYTEVESRYTEVGSRYTEVESRYTEVESRYTEVESRYTEVGSRTPSRTLPPAMFTRELITAAERARLPLVAVECTTVALPRSSHCIQVIIVMNNIMPSFSS